MNREQIRNKCNKLWHKYNIYYINNNNKNININKYIKAYQRIAFIEKIYFNNE